MRDEEIMQILKHSYALYHKFITVTVCSSVLLAESDLVLCLDSLAFSFLIN